MALRKRWWVQVIAALIAIGLVAWVGIIAGKKFTHRTNEVRVQNALSPLVVSPRLVDKAINHSQHMKRQNSLFHRQKPLCNYWGENVGVGPTARSIFRAFMESPEHRANILNPNFKRIGIGIARSKDMLWITVEFCG
jgi:uncharacterized protein YkwD